MADKQELLNQEDQKEQQPEAQQAQEGAGFNSEEAERIANKRSEQATKSALKNYFTQQGMSQEEAEQAFQQFRAAKTAKEEEERNNLSSLQAKYSGLEQQTAEALRQAQERVLKAEALAQAYQLGVSSEKVDYAVRLADLSNIETDEAGNIDQAAVKAALEAVVKDFPEMVRADERTRPGFKLGSAGSNESATNDKLAEIFGNKKGS